MVAKQTVNHVPKAAGARSFSRIMTTEEYRTYQKDMQTLNAMYEIPIDDEVKWDDLWALHKGNPRTEAISKMSEDRLKGYYRKAFDPARRLSHLKYGCFTKSLSEALR